MHIKANFMLILSQNKMDTEVGKSGSGSHRCGAGAHCECGKGVHCVICTQTSGNLYYYQF